MKLSQENIKALISVLENATSKDATRFHMQHVRIEKTGENTFQAVASDGCVLAYRDLECTENYLGTGFKFIHREKIPYLKLLAKEKYIPQDISQYFATETVAFPALDPFKENFRKTYPIQISFNPELLLNLFEAMRDKSLKTQGVTLSFNSPEYVAGLRVSSPIVVSCGKNDGLLMPMRHEANKYTMSKIESEAVTA